MYAQTNIGEENKPQKNLKKAPSSYCLLIMTWRTRGNANLRKIMKELFVELFVERLKEECLARCKTAKGRRQVDKMKSIATLEKRLKGNGRTRGKPWF